MSRLFIELYLDEDVDVLVADLLRSPGFKVTTIAGVGPGEPTASPLPPPLYLCSQLGVTFPYWPIPA